MIARMRSVQSARRWLLLLVLLVAGALSGCASGGAMQRATQGPAADEGWGARFVQGYGRLPTFDEQVAWKEGLEARGLADLSRRAELAATTRGSPVPVQRRVLVGVQEE